MKEIREKSIDELDTLVKRLREELRVKRFGVASGSFRTVHEFGRSRKDLARVLTRLKELQQEKT